MKCRRVSVAEPIQRAATTFENRHVARTMPPRAGRVRWRAPSLTAGIPGLGAMRRRTARPPE